MSVGNCVGPFDGENVRVVVGSLVGFSYSKVRAM